MSDLGYDGAIFEGRVLSKSERRFGYRFERALIIDPHSFRVIVDSAGHDQILELEDPEPGHVLKLSFIKDNGHASERGAVTLTADNPCTIIPEASRLIMDATESTASYLGYTCLTYGVLARN